MKTIRDLSDFSVERSKKYMANGESNYGYAMGYFEGQIDTLLYVLQLSKKQQKLLQEFIERETTRVI